VWSQAVCSRPAAASENNVESRMLKPRCSENSRDQSFDGGSVDHPPAGQPGPDSWLQVTSTAKGSLLVSNPLGQAVADGARTDRQPSRPSPPKGPPRFHAQKGEQVSAAGDHQHSNDHKQQQCPWPNLIDPATPALTPGRLPRPFSNRPAASGNTCNPPCLSSATSARVMSSQIHRLTG